MKKQTTFLFLFVLTITESLGQNPNIIYLMADDQNVGLVGCFGNSVVSAPNMGKIGEEGMLFMRHYNTKAICMASRASSILIFIMKTLLLSAAMLVVTIIISMIRPLSAEENTAQDEGTIMLLLFTVTTVYALVIGLVIKNARGNRLQLIAGLLLAFYGVQTIIGQIEAIFFAETMSSTFIFGVLLFWLFSLAGRNKIQEITKEIYHEPEITSKERRFRHE